MRLGLVESENPTQTPWGFSFHLAEEFILSHRQRNRPPRLANTEVAFSGTMQHRLQTQEEGKDDARNVGRLPDYWQETNGMKAVCEQTEWNAMEKANPGQQHLIQEGITTETEAELLARGESGATKARAWKKR